MKQFFVLFILCFGIQAQSPLIDGIVHLNEWSSAENFSIDYEVDPANNAPATFKTQVYVTNTQTDLLVGFIAMADMKNIRSSIRNRDELDMDEIVAIGIDTYGDGRSMIVLGANPEGSQFDLKILPDGSENDYNLQFETKSSKYEDRYHVEFKIPIRNFSFSEKDIHHWKVVFGRNTYVNSVRKQLLSLPIDRSNPCVICQSNDEIVLTNLVSKKRINILPFLYGGQSGSQNDDGEFKQGSFREDIGMSGLFDLSNTTILEFALNPEFSQVEADVTQIDANETFALFYPEQRPYFNEGNDIIRSNQDAVYTRSINDPLASTKLIHQGQKQRIYWLAAYDQNAPYLVAGENKSYSGEGNEAWANIFSYQRILNQGNHLGIMTTNRFFVDGGNGQLAGLNGLIGIGNNIDLNFEFNYTSIEEPTKDWIDSTEKQGGKTVALDGETKTGNGLDIRLSRANDNWSSTLIYTQYSPLFEAPLGFITQNDLRSFVFHQQHVRYPKSTSSLIQNFSANLEGVLNYNIIGTQKFAGIEASSRIVWRKNFRTGVELDHTFMENYEGFIGKSFTEFSMWNNYNPSEAVSIGAFFSVGEELWYDEDDPAIGDSFYAGSFSTFQPNSNLRIRTTIRYGQLRNKNDQSLYFKGYLARSTINYQFNNNLSFRLISEYNAFDDELFMQPLLKWSPNAFTVFFVGGNNGYSRSNTKEQLHLNDSQVYLKFQYLFGI
jgi:hypothetical protein